MLYRAKRADGMYVWIEASGRIMHEESRTRKVAILVGRVTQAPSLAWSEAVPSPSSSSSGSGVEAEFWSKVTKEGLMLHVSRSDEDEPSTKGVTHILGWHAKEIVGASLAQMTPPEEHDSIFAAIRSAFEGNTVRLEHRMHDRSMRQIEVVTVFHSPSTGVQAKASGTIFCQTMVVTRGDDHRPKRRMTDASSFSSRSSYGSLVPATTAFCPPTPTSISPYQLSLNHIAHHPPAATSTRSGDVFEELHGEDASSHHLSLHRLTAINRRLKRELAEAEATRSQLQSEATSASVEINEAEVEPTTMMVPPPAKRRRTEAEVKMERGLSETLKLDLGLINRTCLGCGSMDAQMSLPSEPAGLCEVRRPCPRF